jgi:hypothetical protein
LRGRIEHGILPRGALVLVVQTAPANGHETIRGSPGKTASRFPFYWTACHYACQFGKPFRSVPLQCDRSDGNCSGSAGGGRR